MSCAMMALLGHYNHPSPGSLYIEENDELLVEKLNVLNRYKLFIIQKKTTAVDCFSSHVTHEIRDHQRNLILKATSRSPSLFSKTKDRKIYVKNRRNVKIFGIVVEPTNNASTGSEATIYIHPSNTRVAHIEKYGGLVGPASFEIFNIDGNTAFTSDPQAKKTANSTVVEYNVCVKSGTVASILMKTGLSFVLNIEGELNSVEKATLLAAILAMDVLQSSTRDFSETSTNNYSYH